MVPTSRVAPSAPSAGPFVLLASLGLLALLAACVAGPAAEGPAAAGPAADRPSFSSGGVALDRPDDGSILRPAPTEHRLDFDAERRHKTDRKAWMKSRHRTPPDVDYKVVEAANGDAQRVKRNALSSMNAGSIDRWVERGSRNQAGRVHVAARSSDGAKLYVGSSRGGVWRGNLDGTGWEPLGDNLYGGAHWLAVVSGVSPGDPDIMVRATDGGAVHRSTDDGATWVQPAGIPGSMNSVRRLLVTTDGSETLFLLVRFWDGGQLKNNLLRSTDKGASFQFSNGLGTWEGDVWAPRDGGGPIYTLKLDKIQVSVDNGDSWSDVANLPVTASGGELAGSEAGAPRLWAILDRGGSRELYRSDDAGLSWQFMTVVTDYWGTLRASTVDPDLFAWGGVEVWRTTDGGNNFAKINGWGEYYGNPAGKLHADNPGMDVVHHGGTETWYYCTDGGLFESTNGGASVQNLSLDGLRVSQYYSTHTSVVNPLHVAAGSQDQGYQWADQPPPAGGTSLDFDQLISGDYGHLTSTDGSHDYLYMTYPGFVLIHKGEDNPSLFTEDFPNTDHDWLPSVVADPWAKIRFFFCGREIYRYERNAGQNVWSHIQWSAQDFATQGGEYVTQLVFSPVNNLLAWAATNYGRLWSSTDHAVTWTLSPDQGPSSHYFYGTALVASAHDVDTVYAGGSGYGSPAVYRTTDGGATWQPWGQGLPDTLVYALAEAPDGSALYAGTETGAYARGVNDAAWVDITDDDAPVTTYWSAEAVPSEDVIRFGTYGRGIWDYQLLSDCAYQAYGVGLGGANTVTLDTTSGTFKGTDHVLEISGGPPSAGGLLFYSQSPAELPLYGGWLLTDPATWVFFAIVVDGNGDLTLPLTIPDNPLAVGLPLNFQVALKDGPGFDDYVFSNGLTGVICE